MSVSAIPAPEGLSVTLSPMRRRHLRAVLRIEEQVYPRPWSMASFLSELGRRRDRFYRVARVGTTVVGFAGAMLVVDEGHVTTIAVDPPWHRHHIGTRLLLAVTADAVAAGAKQMTLEVRVGNDAAQAMYRRFGYAPAGIRRSYYTEPEEDALVMWAHDVDQAPYAARLAALAAQVPGTTRVEALA